MIKDSGIVVIGGSLAAATAVGSLRVHGYDGPITMLSDERYPPYARPPLSKGILAGTEETESVHLRIPHQDVVLRTGARASGLDLDAHEVILSDGERVRFGGLVIATGARAMSLAGPGQSAEFVLRTLDDAKSLRAGLQRAATLLIVGGGFLGFEIASVCRGMGLDVAMIARSPLLARQLGSFLAGFLTRAASEAGVRIVESRNGVRLLGTPRVTGVELADGRRLRADLVVTAIGCRPNVEWLRHSGLPLADGVLVDQRCRLAADIVAAGDVVSFRDLPGGVSRRSPHWTNAVAQARTAAAALLHGDAAPVHDPAYYFWTEGFGLEVKVAGPLPLEGVPRTISGSLENRSALLQYSRCGMPTAAAAVNYRIPVVKLKRLARSAAICGL